MPQLCERRALGDPAHLLEEVVGKGQTLQGGPRLELPVEIVRDMAKLNHLRHVVNIAACDPHVNRDSVRGRGRPTNVDAGESRAAQREYAYGPPQGLPDTKVGTFSQALNDDAEREKSEIRNTKLEANPNGRNGGKFETLWS